MSGFIIINTSSLDQSPGEAKEDGIDDPNQRRCASETAQKTAATPGIAAALAALGAIFHLEPDVDLTKHGRADIGEVLQELDRRLK